MLVSNIRAGLIFSASESSGGRYWWKREVSLLGKTPAAQLRWSSDVQLEVVKMLTQVGANWNPRNHLVFPQEFRARVKTFLLINLRFRALGVRFFVPFCFFLNRLQLPYLPRDPRGLVLKVLASMEYADEEAQLSDVRRLLATSYEKVKQQGLIGAALEHEQEFHAFMKKRNIESKTPQSRKKISREILIEFLVSNELGYDAD